MFFLAVELTGMRPPLQVGFGMSVLVRTIHLVPEYVWIRLNTVYLKCLNMPDARINTYLSNGTDFLGQWIMQFLKFCVLVRFPSSELLSSLISLLCIRYSM